MNYLKDTTQWTDRGMLLKPSRNADEAEFEALKFGTMPIDTGVLDDVIADEHHADLDEIGIHWEDEDLALEQVVGPVIYEIDRRAALGGDAYPFSREGNTLIYKPSKTKVYESCLITSLQRNLSTAPFNALPLTFELICTEVSRLYLGDTAESFRTGWPPYGERPKHFKELMQALNKKTGEFRWCPKFDDLEVKNTKDEGLDFVAWKRFPDQRVGNIFLLGQCACGADWEAKLTDLDHTRLTQWLHPITWADYIRSFAVPHHIPGYHVFSYVCSRAGVTFDRLRLAIIAEMNHALLSEDVKVRAIESIQLLIPNYLGDN